MTIFFRQLKLLTITSLQREWQQKDRLAAPICFAVVLQTIFTFAFDDLPDHILQRTQTAQIFLTVAFAFQTRLLQAFDTEQQDRILDLMKSYSIDLTALFISRCSVAFTLGCALVIPVLCINTLFAPARDWEFSLWLGAMATLALIGLTALGTLLAAITIRASSREGIYPIAYFSLGTPIFLAGIQATLGWDSGFQACSHWVYLLASFDVIYFTLGLLLTEVLLKEA